MQKAPRGLLLVLLAIFFIPFQNCGPSKGFYTHEFASQASSRASPASLIGGRTEIAPYFYYWNAGKVNRLTDARRIMGLSSASYAFIVSSNGCNIEGTLADSLADVQAYVASGGSLITSFGGAGGVYLEVACTEDTQLFNIMDKVIIDTGSQRIDFDVEGSQVTNTVAHQRRARVLARLRTKYPNLYVSFTLAGWLNGLSADSLNVIKITEAAGVRINIVNVMTMSWGAESIQNMVSPSTLGQATINTIEATVGQLKQIYPSKTTAQIYGMIGITPMIGTNDDNTTFTLADANTVANYAKSKAVGLIGYWAFQRDQAQTTAGSTPLNSWSGVVQLDFQFYNNFKKAQSASAAPAP